MNVQIRNARPEDLEAINEIYNQAVLTTTATFDTEPKSIEHRRDWFAAHGARHPVLVALADQIVAGWASLSPWSARPAYDATVESSVYVSDNYQRQGIGRALQDQILQAARDLEMRSVIAQITDENQHSIRLHTSFGFEVVGTLRAVGYKFDRWLDVQILQLMLK